MKLSANTVEVLKNYSTINPSILVKPGNVLSTIHPQRAIFAKTTVEESFPQQFAIYELSKFLGVISLFNEPELVFGDMVITIKSGGQKLSYTCASASLIIAPPEKEMTFPAADIEFDIKQDELQKLIRAGSVLQLPDIAAVGNGKTISLTATNTKVSTTDQYSVDVGTTDKNFSMVFKMDNIIKLISSDYNVKISGKGISKFESTSNMKTLYYVATEANSKFGE
jgi:hypothetical protein